MTFWERVNAFLHLYNMPRKALAIDSGVSLECINKGIAVKSIPSADNALRIAKTLNTTVEFLLTGQDPHDLSFGYKKNEDVVYWKTSFDDPVLKKLNL